MTTTDIDLDGILSAWLREGGERAPEQDVALAVARVASTRQQRAWLPRRSDVTRSLRAPRARLAIAAVVLMVLATAAMVLVVGSTAVRRANPAPLPNLVPVPTGLTTTLRRVPIQDRAPVVSIPETWDVVDAPCCDYVLFSGAAPEGRLSVGLESPFQTTVCSPACRTVQLPMTIPYSASSQVTGLKSSVGAIAGSDAWAELPERWSLPITDGAWLDSIGRDADGRAWRRVHVVGLVERNVVAIAWSQPVEAFDALLVDQVLAAIELPPGPTYSDGDLQATSSDGFALPLPGFWGGQDQPTLDGRGLSGVRRFGEGRAIVSIGSPEGRIGWCDPDCVELTGQRSLATLEGSIRAGRPFAPSEATRLGGEEALSFGSAAPAERRYVVTFHGGRPVALMVDVGDWDVAPGVVDQILAGFRFADSIPVPSVGPSHRYPVADGHAVVTLPEPWEPSASVADAFVWGSAATPVYRLHVWRGDERGVITISCPRPNPWEPCGDIRAATLEAIGNAVEPLPIAYRGIGPPLVRRDEGTLDGERSVIVRVEAYEPPARGGQEVVYIAAIHSGRPYLLRIWTSNNTVGDIQWLISGFRFTD